MKSTFTARTKLWLRLFALSLCTPFIQGCSLSPLKERTSTVAISLEEANQTSLGRSFAPLAAEHPDLSGIYALADPHEAFAARSILARFAEKSIDVQYYIWRADTTGYMLLDSLLQAANRGVRIRLLLDDNGINHLDTELALLNTHDNIEVRLFNPFSFRSYKRIGFLFDLDRLNHRMHNKSFTVDNTITIVGGRNIGDEYFGATDQVLFADLDVIAIGEVVTEVSADFDLYWASPLSYPIDQLISLKSDQTLDQIAFDQKERKNPTRAERYLKVLEQSDLVQNLVNHQPTTSEIMWVKTEMVSDDPAKALGNQIRPQQLMTYQLQRAIGTPDFKLDLISPYFVPTKTGTQSFALLAQNPNLQIRILTNSYEATDVGAVHAGYMKRREDLLKAGIELYELKQNSSGNLQKVGKNRFGSSGSSLHAKTFAIDNKRVFVGSFNFDPRSANLNTELGFVIHSPKLAKEISGLFDNQIPYESYQLVLNDQGKLHWIERTQSKEPPIVHNKEPGTHVLNRVWLKFLSKLPIEWML